MPTINDNSTEGRENRPMAPERATAVFIFSAAFLIILLCFLIFWYRKSYNSPVALVPRRRRESAREASEAAETQRMNQIETASFVTLPRYTEDKDAAPPAYDGISQEESRLSESRVLMEERR